MLSADDCYNALLSDNRAQFDGRFFIAVSSTKIYCRPTCSARLPKHDNLTYFEIAGQAEAAGYRPCLKCHPELAPDLPLDYEDSPLAWRTYRLLREHYSEISDINDFLGRSGIDSSKASQAFEQRFGITLQQQLTTFRLGMAKQLISKTNLTFDLVANAVGLSTVNELAHLLNERYRFKLDAMRRPRKDDSAGCVSLHIPYRPPYDWQRIADFLALRAIPGVELVKDGTYWRTARIQTDSHEAVGWLSVAPTKGKNALTVTLSNSLLPALSMVLERIRHQFDLDACPDVISETLSAFDRECPGRYAPGLRVPGCFDPYEMSVRAILGQQISVKGASTLAGRVAAEAGLAVEVPVEGLTHTFPSPIDITRLPDAQNTLGSLGIISRRVKTIIALAEGLNSGQLCLAYGADPTSVVAGLEAMPGIGPWTAQYIAMRTIGYADAFPSSDLGVKKALAPKTVREIEAVAETWRPWRAYATLSLWTSGH